VGRSIQVASTVLVIVAVVCVLVTPDLGDDVDGVIHKTPLNFSLIFSRFHVGGLTSAPPVLSPVATNCNRSFQLVDLICVRLC
jgi:hypothetical protein